MAVRRDKNGQWRYRIKIKLPNGQKLRISGTPEINTKLEAEKAERAHIARTLNPPPLAKKEVPTFGKFAEEWFEVYPSAAGLRPSTKRSIETHLRVHLLPHLRSVPLDQVRGLAVDKLFASMKSRKHHRGSGLSAKTIHNVRGTLHKILATAADWERLPAVPRLQRVKVPQARFDFFTREESEALLQAARNEEERLMMLFALHTGARVSEQLALKWADVDFRNRFIVIRQAVIRGEVGPTKNGRERKVPLTASLEAALKRHKHLRSELVFCNHKGEPLEDWSLLDRLRITCRRAGLRGIRWHELRHSFASQLVIAGVPIRQVQEWLGHSTITMTLRYSHLAPGGDSKLIAALDQRVEPAAWQQRGKETGTGD